MLRRVGTILAPGVLTAVGMGAVVLPHTVGLEYSKDATQAYKDGFPVPIPANIHSIFMEVKKDAVECASSLPSHNITVERLNSIHPYTVFGFDMFSLGWLKSEYGGWLGVPEYFKYTDGCPPSSRIRISNRQVPWQDPAGKKLKDALSISEDAKQFAIARETLLLCQDETDNRFVNMLGNMMLTVAFARGLQDRLNLRSRPMLVSGIIYAMVGTVGVTFWLMINDTLTVRAERNADAAAASLGERYVRAGVEYCESIVNRNLALRELMGEEGDSVYTACGNEQTMVRLRHLPIVERLNFFKGKRDALNTPQSDVKA